MIISKELRLFMLAVSLMACHGHSQASGAQMRLDGLWTELLLVLLYLWGWLIVIGHATSLFRWLGTVVVASMLTLAIAVALPWTWEQGRLLRSLPLLPLDAAIVFLMLLACLMLASPWLDYRQGSRFSFARASGWLALGLVCVPVVWGVWGKVQEAYGSRALAIGRSVAEGNIHKHAVASADYPGRFIVSPYLWSAEKQRMWTLMGLSGGFIERAEPLQLEDTEGLQLLLGRASPDTVSMYGWKIKAKLAWDRFLSAPPDQRPSMLRQMAPYDLRVLVETFGMRYTKSICTKLDPPTVLAFEESLRHIDEHTAAPFRRSVSEHCGVILQNLPAK